MSRRTARNLVLTVVALAAVGVSSGAEPTELERAATDAPRNPRSYSIRVWQREQGLPQNSVTAITQDADGYLWLGTWDGLARFDGARFVTFDGVTTPALHNGRITSLFTAKDGSVWIGHEPGNVTQLKNGAFISRRAPSTAANQGIVGISTDESGGVWVLGRNGQLESLADGHTVTSNDGIRDPSPFLLFAPGEHGDVALARNGLLSTLAGGKLMVHALADHPGDTGIYGMVASRRGGLWIVSEGQIRRLEHDQWVEHWGPTPWNPQDAAGAVVELRNGSLAVGTLNSGIYIVAKGRPTIHFDRKNGLPHDWVRAIHEDLEGNIWVGTGSGGLAMLREATFTTIDSPDARNGRSVLGVAPSQSGGVWIATEGAGLYHYKEGGWAHFGESDGLNNGFIWSVAESIDGSLWLGTWGGGLFRREGAGLFRRDPALDASTPILSLLESPTSKTLWVGTRAGLVNLRTEGPRAYGVADGLVSPDVRAIVEDRDGTIWFGMVGGGLGRIQRGELRQFNKADGLSSAFVQCLLPDESGALWIGTTDGGLNRLKNGRFSVIGTQQGLPSNVIGHIIDDGRGFLWMSTHNGIFRLAKEDANRCADGLITGVTGQHFGRSEGLPSLEFTGGQTAGCRTPDGRLWFSTDAGVVTVDPRDVPRNAIRPRTLLEEVTIDGVTMLSSRTGMRIPAGRRRVEFRYTGLSFVAPEKVSFRFRLIGLEDDWMNAGTKREVSFSYLPPGRYRFEVLAANNDGAWSSESAAQEFFVEPFYWQTWWFRSAGTLLVLGVAAGTGLMITRQRMKRRVARAEQQHAIERERTRIARDIHDDLGASLTRITLLSQAARGGEGTPPSVASDLEQIYGTAREVTRSMDEIVWAVNPKHDTLDSLGAYLGKFAQDFLRTAHVRCRLDIPLELPAWRLTAEVRHNVFLAFKETLHNVLKHSQAQEVRIRLVADVAAKMFVLTIEDNGRGFTAGETNGGQTDRIVSGQGMLNMQSRLAEIGGRYELSSAPGSGTCWRFIVMVPAANA